jgi:tripartite-type tricarboxylate transporter receptor subunit TctC
MKPSRRRFLSRAAAAAVALPALPRLARAQAYPTRPVRILVATAAGGTTDIVARLLAQWLADKLGQPFVVENRPGGGTNIGTEMAVRAPPDGYTLLMANSSAVVNQALHKNLPFKFSADLVPVAIVMRSPLLMLVNPSVPAKTGAEFIAHAKANPGNVNMGSGGVASTGHMSGELFQMMAGVKLQHVPYRGEAMALPDLIGGQVQVMFSTIGSSLQYVKGDKLRALAITTATRSDLLPAVPPVAEFVPGYESNSWNGLTAPKDTPAAIVELLNKEVNAAMADAKIKEQFIALGGPPIIGPASAFGQIIRDDTEKWAKVVAFSGVTGN